MPQVFVDAFFSAGFVAIAVGMVLLIRSLSNFSRTGPEIQKEIQEKFFYYSAYALARLVCWSSLIVFCFALPGSLLGTLSYQLVNQGNSLIASILAGLFGFALIAGRQLLNFLLYNPGIIATSANFNTARLYCIWQKLTPNNLKLADFALLILFGATDLLFLGKFAVNHQWQTFVLLFLVSMAYWIPLWWLSKIREPAPVCKKEITRTPNILMIGSDTLRADHLGAYGYSRPTSPCIDSLAKQSTLFYNCYVPLARTAPSLVSLFTGCWPDKHRIKDNFISDVEAQNLSLPSLAECLEKSGYRTSTISDWSGGDLGKFNLGFENKELPEDQWNLKYLIRQGPKDIRLFLSLFCHNKFGKFFMPELYYLAGIPLTRQLGLEARHEIARLAKDDQPFLLNLFMGTTHPPFSSNYPYYQLFSSPNYEGHSKFCMSRLTSPEEIIKSQQEPRDAFDLDQIISLYDGSIRQFDEEVGKILEYLELCRLIENTIIVIYSDHGMELFEHDTWGQGNSIAGDSSAHIPLIFYNPGAKEAARYDEKIRSIDIMPTLLDFCGVSIPDTVDGISLKPVMKGDAPYKDLAVFYETGIWLSTPPKRKPNHIGYPDIFNLLEIADQKSGTLSLRPEYAKIIESARDWFIWKGPWKLKCYALQDGPYYELFNTVNDPYCKVNLAKDNFQIVTDLIFLRNLIKNANSCSVSY